jgi:CAAX protease family protein
MVVAANAAVGKSWAHHATGILAGLMAGAVFLLGVFDLTLPAAVGNPAAVDYGIMATGVAAAALAAKPVRERAARIIPIDPDSPVHTIALVLAVILLGSSLASLAFTDVLATFQKLPPLTIADLLSQEVPLLVLGLAGVGLWMRRDLAATARRLAIVVPAWWQVALALATAGLFFAFGVGANDVGHILTPNLANRVDTSTAHLFSGLGGPVGIVALALIPGICEDLLFRGALQPRFGLVLTALLFTAIHTEYALSIDALSIFVIALGLGAIRKYANTTTSAACHVAYNLLVGVNLTGTALDAAVAVEVVLVAIVGFVLWSGRRRGQEQIAESSGVS